MILLRFLKEPHNNENTKFPIYLIILLMLLFTKYGSIRLIQNHISLQLVKKKNGPEVFSCFHVLRIVPCDGTLRNK